MCAQQFKGSGTALTECNHTWSAVAIIGVIVCNPIGSTQTEICSLPVTHPEGSPWGLTPGLRQWIGQRCC